MKNTPALDSEVTLWTGSEHNLNQHREDWPKAAAALYVYQRGMFWELSSAVTEQGTIPVTRVLWFPQ